MALTEQQIVDLINGKLAEQEKRHKKELDHFKKENQSLMKRVQILETDIIELSKDLETTKRATYNNDQYQRRNNIELSGIPEKIKDDELEDFCCRLVNNIICEPGEPFNGENEICAKDFEACHRLRTKNNTGVKDTILRFTNRKICDDIFLNKHKLKNLRMEKLEDAAKNIFVNENICSYYKELGAKCRRLKKRRKITDTWTTYGTVKLKLKDGTVKIITHQNDLDIMFPDFIYFQS